MQQQYQCPNCHVPVAYGVKFCGNCGQPLNWQQQPQPPPQYQQPPQQQYQQYQQVNQQPPQKAYQQQNNQPRYPPQGKPPMSNTKKGLIGLSVIVVVFLAILGTCIGELSGPTDTDTTTAISPTPESTSATPSTESLTLTAAESAYASSVADQSTTMGTALTKLGDLMQNYQFGDDEWTIDVATQLAIIRVTYDEAMALEPPSSMTEIHYKYVQGLKHFNTMTELLARGIDQLDSEIIDQATTEMYTGRDYLLEATGLLNDFTESKSH